MNLFEYFRDNSAFTAGNGLKTAQDLRNLFGSAPIQEGNIFYPRGKKGIILLALTWLEITSLFTLYYPLKTIASIVLTPFFLTQHNLTAVGHMLKSNFTATTTALAITLLPTTLLAAAITRPFFKLHRWATKKASNNGEGDGYEHAPLGDSGDTVTITNSPVVSAASNSVAGDSSAAPQNDEEVVNQDSKPSSMTKTS